MDTKSLAKSKRAHTQHHNKKSHAVHKQKAAENSKNHEKLQGGGNQTAAALKTKSPVQSRRVSALPSNWDRYDEQLDPGLENASRNQPEDAILPKSKGADYLHLLSEAQAESQSKIEIDSDGLSSLDDLLHDEFSRVVGSMISARGESMLSWMEDDNFIVEEEGSASYHEPGFLSLNLNALEKMLEKVDLHERLYIEADLLPPEICASQSKVSPDKDVEAESLDQVKDIPIFTDQTEKPSAIEDDLDLLLDSYALASASNQNPSAFEADLDSLLNSNSGAEPFNKPANPSGQKIQTTGFDDMLDDLLESTSVSTKPQQNQASSSSSSSVGKSKVLDEFDSWLDTI
ncbi:unnamed protein product [Thlaspi arvense]|uniref:Uncharacterized protein n=1 Tax=Thlaspi arvense TaxID=13288 RepID=A0AAU9RPG1_THLAR|nr:unnamed protein product [Thlaspi arvense]